MTRHGVELRPCDGQAPVRLGHGPPVILLGASQGLGNEKGLVAFQVAHVHALENRREGGIAQDAPIKNIDHGLDGVFTPQFFVKISPSACSARGLRGGFHRRRARRIEGRRFRLGKAGSEGFGRDHLSAQSGHNGTNGGDVLLAHAQPGHGIAQMGGHPVKLAVGDRQSAMGLGEVASIILFGASKRLRNEQGLMAFQRPHVHFFKYLGKLRVFQYPIVKRFHQGLDGVLTPVFFIESNRIFQLRHRMVTFFR